jgi:hypothetical protein
MIVTLINKDTKQELTNLLSKQYFIYTTGNRVILLSNNQTIRVVGTEQELMTITNSNGAKPMFIQANPRGTGMEWFAIFNGSTYGNYYGIEYFECIRYLDWAARNVNPDSRRDAAVAAFTPPGQSSPVPIRNVIMTLRKSLHNFCNVAINPDIASWDTYNVTDFSYMLSNGNSEWNQNINHWNVSRGRNFEALFSGIYLSLFNQPLNNWDISNATNVRRMFRYNTYMGNPYQQDLSNWYFNNFGTTLLYDNESFDDLPVNNRPIQFKTLTY